MENYLLMGARNADEDAVKQNMEEFSWGTSLVPQGRDPSQAKRLSRADEAWHTSGRLCSAALHSTSSSMCSPPAARCSGFVGARSRRR
ncbi:hypothetical protein QYE76_033999 [Lolium multiflorum]|uniref:Uncharacterized protein n=1 Tax=Lolium multiflorum TaxID=4521 RepID=A0AAD8VM22_LOLMU|nr:hypothetical protein QYE76_033999 [Lolium multiflorum]